MQTNPWGTIRFTDKVALITGGASGIGQSNSERLAAEGAHVIIADNNAEMAHQAVSQIQEAGGKAIYIEVDLADDESVIAAARVVAEKFSALHALVNNAAILRTGKIEEEKKERRRRGVATELGTRNRYRSPGLGVDYTTPVAVAEKRGCRDR